MKREFLDYVEDIVGAMSNSEEFVRGMKYEEFIKDQKTIYAVVRALEIIGEAVGNPRARPEAVSGDTVEKYGGHERQINPRIFWGEFENCLGCGSKRYPPLKTFFRKNTQGVSLQVNDRMGPATSETADVYCNS